MPNLSYYKMLSALDKHRTAIPVDHPDRSVTRAKLEKKYNNVSFAYLATIDEVVYSSCATNGYVVLARDIFSDKAVFASCQVNTHCALVARQQNFNSFYINYFNPSASSADHYIDKYVNGTATRLATEAIDINNMGKGLMISTIGSTIKSMRFEMTSIIDPFNLPAPNYTLTVTDTTFQVGYFGYRPLRENSPHGGSTPDAVYLKDPMSPAPQPIIYLEVPVVGSGTPEDPFKPDMPEEIVDHPVHGKVNRLSLTWSAVIKTGADGKPVEYTAIVRVFHQPDRPDYLHSIGRALDKLASIQGVKRLSREGAIRRVKQLDDKIHDYDLVRVKPNKERVKEYKNWRLSLGVKEELINEEQIAHYIEEDKGW